MFTAKEPTASRRVLHNFSFPNQVSWDSKRVLRCKSPVTARSRKKPPSMEAPPPWNLRNRRPEEQSPDPNPNPSLLTPFSVSLSFDEIEEDFVRMKGRKPYRRPKKRARIVQKKLDSLFPGLWLQEEIMAYSSKIDD